MKKLHINMGYIQGLSMNDINVQHKYWFALRGGYVDMRPDVKANALQTLAKDFNSDNWFVNIYGA